MFPRLLLLAFFSVIPTATTLAQDAASDDDSGAAVTILPQHGTDRIWLSGQINIISQSHGRFRAAYSGDHSLRSTPEHTTSTLWTVFTGVRVTHRTDVLFDVEAAGGRGLSDALGLAGFTDLDVVRNPTLGAAPYVARVFVHHVIALSSRETPVEPSPFSLARALPERRLEIRAGKFSTADLFDVNSAGSDSHLQFMNWTVDNNGAYDYAADTRGYTAGVVVEYGEPRWSVRFGELLMPKVANGLDLDWNVGRARAENVEAEYRTSGPGHQHGAIRVLAYVNHANMGDYRQALQRVTAGVERVPVIESTREQGRLKYGFGVNVEQPITAALRLFGRWGWNEPHFESFAYTEVNASTELGADYRGTQWKRPHDKAGLAVVVNAISEDHRDYLARGGSGFLLGDGGLDYGCEDIVEGYYTAHLWRGIFASADVQHVVNPGYNRDRGPVIVAGARLHVDF